MATKAAKPAAKSAETGAAAPKSQKMLFIVIGLVLLILIGGGAAAFMMMNAKKASSEHAEESAVSKAPVFVVIEPFVVNLQQENGDQFLQIAITLQVPNSSTADSLKVFMPQVRSRLLMVLSSKKASELTTSDGKRNLTDEIIDQLGEPFDGSSKGPTINDVFYTSFVIQQQ